MRRWPLRNSDSQYVNDIVVVVEAVVDFRYKNRSENIFLNGKNKNSKKIRK